MEKLNNEYTIRCKSPTGFYFNLVMIFILAVAIFAIHNFGDQPIIVLMLLIFQAIQIWWTFFSYRARPKWYYTSLKISEEIIEFSGPRAKKVIPSESVYFSIDKLKQKLVLGELVEKKGGIWGASFLRVPIIYIQKHKNEAFLQVHNDLERLEASEFEWAPPLQGGLLGVLQGF